jgi:CBS domain containing-hemolysin-like protein
MMRETLFILLTFAPEGAAVESRDFFTSALYVLLVFVLVLANGFFVAAEFALVGVRRSRIEMLAAAGQRKAQRLLGLLNNLNAYISATQLGITLSSLGLGYVGEPAIAHILEAPLRGRVSDAVLHTISFAVAFSIITFLHIVIGELAPKTLALEMAERVSYAVAIPLQLFYKIFYLPIRMLDWAGTRTVRLFGLHPTSDHASIYTEDELRALVDASHRSGHLQAEESQLINRVFDFHDAEVREAMIPRTEIVALPETATLADTERAFCEHGYSRLPVYRERLDEVVGVIFLKDLLPCLRSEHPVTFDLEAMLHPPLFVPATARLDSVLAQMQARRSHLACVVDEHGGLEGIVTLEDLLEEIVGEIDDEYDEEVRAQITEEPDGTYTLDGMLAVRDANRRFDLDLPEDAGYTTLAGFLLARAGRILLPGETVEHDGALFLVELVEGRRIRRVRYTPAPSETEQANEVREAARQP